MTSIPVTNFVYDSRGNVINVMPAGSSGDVVVHGRMDETSPGVVSRDAPTTSQTVRYVSSATSVPLIAAQTVFGYANYPTSPDTLDMHRITTATPLVTVTRQPDINNRGEGTVNLAQSVPVTTAARPVYLPPTTFHSPVVQPVTEEAVAQPLSSVRQLGTVYSETGALPRTPVVTPSSSRVTRFVRRPRRYW